TTLVSATEKRQNEYHEQDSPDNEHRYRLSAARGSHQSVSAWVDVGE
ncbi:hypothetical protein LCGC14_2956540, partial [marine sediment metagenome]